MLLMTFGSGHCSPPGPCSARVEACLRASLFFFQRSMAMSTFFDVRFKFPWNLHGYSRHDRIAFGLLTGYKHFFIVSAR